jgi:hypothetical protein
MLMGMPYKSNTMGVLGLHGRGCTPEESGRFAVIGVDAVDLGWWASLVVLAAGGVGVIVWLARIVWGLAGWGMRWRRRHRPVT